MEHVNLRNGARFINELNPWSSDWCETTTVPVCWRMTCRPPGCRGGPKTSSGCTFRILRWH